MIYDIPLVTINQREIIMNDKALKIKDVALTLSVHRQTVWNLIKAGKLEAVRVSPRRRAILQSEINRYLNTISRD